MILQKDSTSTTQQSRIRLLLQLPATTKAMSFMVLKCNKYVTAAHVSKLVMLVKDFSISSLRFLRISTMDLSLEFGEELLLLLQE